MKYQKRADGLYHFDKMIDGKRCQLSAKTVKDMDRKYTEWVRQSMLNRQYDRYGQPFYKVGDEWLADAEQRVAITTFPSYQARYKDIRKHFAKALIESIEVKDINSYFSTMEKRNKSKKTITNAKIVLSQIFEYNILYHGGKHNPVKFSKVPRSAPSTKREPPTDGVIEKVKNNPNIIVAIVMYTGIRIGEANGIQKKDIHLDDEIYGIKGYIDINKKVVWKGNEPIVQNFTKTEAGIRKVPIFKPLRSVLIEAIKDLNDNDYVLSRAKKPQSRKQQDCQWVAYCRSIGEIHGRQYCYKEKDGKKYYRDEQLANFTPHQFRHYLATVMYEQGIGEITAAKILGHKSIETTHKIYTHIREKLMQESLQKMENAF